MIGLLAFAAIAACIPLAEADRFGEVGFAEQVEVSDPRFASSVCNEDGCTAYDRSGVEYRVAHIILMKRVSGVGPSASFRSSLSRSPLSDRTLSAPVCGDGLGMWIELETAEDGRPAYGLFAQP